MANRPVPLLPLLLFLAFILPAAVVRVSSAAISATWIELDIDSSTAPSPGFCDHWTDLDPILNRIALIGGDNGDTPVDSSPVGLWTLDFSSSFESPTWQNAATSSSSATVPDVGGGPAGALRYSPAYPCVGVGCYDMTAIVFGGHDLNAGEIFNQSYRADVNVHVATQLLSAAWDDIADDGTVSDTGPMPGLAWSTACWGDVAQTQLFMYGGVDQNTGLDNGDLWLLDLTATIPAWRNITALTSGDTPRQLSGTRLQFDVARNQLVMMGGYSCTENYFSGQQGGTACFTNTVWYLSLNTSTLYQWTAHTDPGSAAVYPWPSARAFHSTVIYGSELWIFAGQYVDASLTNYFYNDVAVFDLVLLRWLPTRIKGTTPPVMWSQTSNLVLSHDDGVHHMVVIGGCTGQNYYNQVYALKLHTAVVASNCEATGQGLVEATAGVESTFVIQTRHVNSRTNSTVQWGAALTWGVSLEFSVYVIGQVGSVTTIVESSVVELGGGLYSVSYSTVGGAATSCGEVTEVAKVTISVQLDGVNVPNSPFVVPIAPAQLVAEKTQTAGQIEAVQEQMATFTVSPADQYGNVAQTPQNASLLIVLVSGNPPESLSISTATAGRIAVSYIAPAVESYVLSVSYNGSAVAGSPFTIMPLSNLDISHSQEIGVQAVAAVASVAVLVCMALVVYYRGVPVVKSASPSFTLLILAGCQLVLVSSLFPAVSTTADSCLPYAWTLSVGSTLVFSSLIAKTWRIARIFESKRMRVKSIKDHKLVIPVLGAVAAELIFNGIWLRVDPLLATEFVSSSNSLVHYVACSSHSSGLWYALTFGMKGALLVYCVRLASQVRKVPTAFNDSHSIALSVYNVTFCGLAVIAMLFLLASAPSSVYLVRNLITVWCVVVTTSLLLVPKVMHSRSDAAEESVDSKANHTLQSSGNSNYRSSGAAVQPMKELVAKAPRKVAPATSSSRAGPGWSVSAASSPMSGKVSSTAAPQPPPPSSPHPVAALSASVSPELRVSVVTSQGRVSPVVAWRQTTIATSTSEE